MDDEIKRYLQGMYLSKTDLDSRIPELFESSFESRVGITSPRSIGRNGGITLTETLYTRENWRMNPDSFKEYQRFIEDITQIDARRLTDEDAGLVSGDSFRGTDVFLLILALYTTGSALGIRDYSTYNPENRRIEIKQILSTPRKSVAIDYANKYVGKDGEVLESFREIEEPIFKRVLLDNNAEEIPMPDFMLQPVVLGLGKAYRNDYEHKEFEGIAYNSTPNISTLNLLARLTGNDPQQFSKNYPILSSKFKR